MVKRKLKHWLFAVSAFAFSALVWAWMFGAFAVPESISGNASEHLTNWSDPGLLAMPAVVSVFVALAGVAAIITADPHWRNSSVERKAKDSRLEGNSKK